MGEKPSNSKRFVSKAMFYLLEDAARDRAFNADYFIFLSESCIPIYPLEPFLEQLESSGGKSWIDFTSEPSNGYAYTNQFEPLKQVVPESCIYKSDQWVMLNRTHAMQLLDFQAQTNISIWDIMRHVRSASDEMWIATILCLMNGGRLNSDVLEKRKVTFVDWGDEMRNPLTFDEIRSRMIREAQSRGCLFARKFKNRDPRRLEEDWHHVVMKR